MPSEILPPSAGWGTDEAGCVAHYNEEAVLRELHGLLAHIGVDGEFKLLRHGSTSVYRIRGRSLILRVTREPLKDRQTVVAELSRLSHLAETGAPVLGPIRQEPINLKGAWATLWPEGERELTAPSYSLGRVLAQLHLFIPPPGLPRGEQAAITRVDQRIDGAVQAGAPTSVIEAIRSKRLELGSNLECLIGGIPRLAHGDAHTGNLVQHAGKPLLVDLDDLCIAPREMDFAPSEVSSRRFKHLETAYRDLLAGYDMPESEIDQGNLAIYCQLRELTMISWLATLWGVEPRSRRELQNRVEGWDTPTARWRPL